MSTLCTTKSMGKLEKYVEKPKKKKVGKKQSENKGAAPFNPRLKLSLNQINAFTEKTTATVNQINQPRKSARSTKSTNNFMGMTTSRRNQLQVFA